MRILLIEDDLETAAYLVDGLKELGYAVDHCANGKTGLVSAEKELHDLIILDRMLPGMDGLAIVSHLRAQGVKAPVLFLTTVSGIDDRVEGLNAGADDYLVKPFAFSELSARVKALLRRSAEDATGSILRVGNLELDLIKRCASRDGRRVELQSQEFKLLEFFMRHAGQVVTRTMLLEKVWEFHFDPQTNVVETNISRLRSKIHKEFDEEFIHTIRGVGYRFGASE